MIFVLKDYFYDYDIDYAPVVAVYEVPDTFNARQDYLKFIDKVKTEKLVRITKNGTIHARDCGSKILNLYATYLEENYKGLKFVDSDPRNW